MPRHLISDAHEWINEIPTVPIYYLAKPQPRERAWRTQRGKKTLLSLTLHKWEALADSEIPLLSSILYLFGKTRIEPIRLFILVLSAATRWPLDSRRRQCQAGSLTGPYERNRRFRHLVHVLGRSANGAKLPSEGL
ncbi:unnamed protein product [Toxocara canis]|uniref:Transposase n=2 Tax=Spirurina TaxID=6274 RepID=A0A183V938_TOXCA|nr:unnamed protein product [Toxocara canis]